MAFYATAVPVDAPPQYTKHPELPSTYDQHVVPSSPVQRHPQHIPEAIPQYQHQEQHSEQAPLLPTSSEGVSSSQSPQQYTQRAPEQNQPAFYGTTPSSASNRHIKHRGFRDRFFWNDACANLDDGPMRTEVNTLRYSADLDLSVKVLDGIIGNVDIKENDNWEEERILIRWTLRGSDSKVFDKMQVVSDVDGLLSKFDVQLEPEDEKDKKKLLKGRCARVDAVVLYPRASPDSKHLAVETLFGDINVKMEGVMAIVDSMFLRSTVGNVNIHAASVKGRTDILVVKGKVRGTLKTIGAVNVTTTNGAIDLEVNSAIGVLGWTPTTLNVYMSAVKGPVSLDLTQKYHGHFSLDSGYHKQPNFHPSSAYSDVVQYSINSRSRLVGWISAKGHEPPGALPNIQLSSVSGPTQITILDPRKRGDSG
ncbi:hypothetical protein BG011_004375 [Mortierella polycephala]|uniref:Uncharacterized protein n=1 Tax=Mortierella polycephala TaxID=41804 RepID=A0A9P6PYE9_9FUNG|nr:hypothetical protein BG011_004375 [Mortierella polycephala]